MTTASPRIERLAADLAAGRLDALDAFWTWISATGTPIVELVDANPDDRLVTYVWRATHPGIKTVQLVGAPRWTTGDDVGEPHRMTRLGTTDMWYSTFRVRADLRHRYAFFESADDQDFCYEDGLPLLRIDPGNPETYPDQTADETIAQPLSGGQQVPASVLALDKAPAQPWVRRDPAVVPGTVRQYEFRSSILGNARRVWVYLPPGYREDRDPYGLLLMNDGWEWVSPSPIAPILDSLVAAGRIPPLVAVLQESPDGQRNAELGCDEEFATAVGAELLPWIRLRWNVDDSAARTIVAGQSYGGLSAAFLALRRPDLFGNVLAQSGSFWFPTTQALAPDSGWLIRQYATTPRLPLRFYLDVGLLEGSMVGINRHLRDVLEAKGYPVTYREFHGDHTWLSWRGTIGEALVALTTDW